MKHENELFQDIGRNLEQLFQPSPDIAHGFPWMQHVAWFILCIGTIVCVVSLVALLAHVAQYACRHESYRRRSHGRKAFKWWAATTFVAGYLLYLVGFFWEGTSRSLTALLFRPFLSSLEMFVSHSDLLEVDEHCKDNPIYMALFALTHFSAVAVSASFAINCFWRRIIFWIRRKMWTLFPSSRTVNIFFGVDERSLMTARDLYEHSVGNAKERIVFIDMPGEEHHEAQRMSFSHIFGLFSYKTEQVQRMTGLKSILMHSASLPHRMEHANRNALDSLELQALRPIMRHASCVRLFFLSRNGKDNVKAVLNVLQDRVFVNIRPVVYCQAQSTPVNRSVYAVTCAEVHLVHEGQLAANALKLMRDDNDPHAYKAHPIRFVETNKRLGCVTSTFTSLTIGFGETGQNAFRFLYEFSAFAGADGQQSPARHFIVDRRMNELGASFCRRTPALRTAAGKDVTFIQEDIHTQAFWDRLGSLIDSLNYVVIAPGDDESGLALAVDIWQYAVRHRKDGTNRLGIFVRSYDAENETQLMQIAKHSKGVITPFGTTAELYSKRTIVDNELRAMARLFYTNYNRTLGLTNGCTWEERRAQSLEATDAATAALRRQSLYRKEFQDMENSLHRYTKRMLTDEAYLKEPLPRPEEFSFAPSQDARHACLVNLSIGEHLRWNASHYMLGYTGMTEEEQRALPPDTSCDEKNKKHKCLTDWKNLSEELKRLDYSVVYTTFTQTVKESE